jgi:outer membrane protein assembly factor BamB
MLDNCITAARKRCFEKLVFVAFFFSLACSPQGNARETKGGGETHPEPKAIIDEQNINAGPAPQSIASAPNSGWTTFRGDRARTGRAHIKGPRKAKLSWVFRTQGRIYADAAVAVDGTVYVASHDNHLYAVDTDGRERWSYDAGGKIWSSPAVAADGSIYFGSDADRLVSLDRMGTERWIFSTEQPPEDGEKSSSGRWDVDTSPVIAADGTVIFGCNLFVYAVRPNGMLRWYFKAGVGKAKIFSSPAMGSDGTIYFGTQGSYFFALDGSAKVLWHVKTGGDNDSTPAVGDDGTIYFGSDDKKVRAVAPGGNLKWEISVEAPVRAPVSIGHDGTVFASTYDEKPFLAALDGSTGKEKWRFHIEPGKGSFYGIQSGALVDSDGYVYFGGRDGYVYCLSPEGELVWRYKTGDQVDSGPVMGPDGTLYIGSDDKRLYAFSPVE